MSVTEFDSQITDQKPCSVDYYILSRKYYFEVKYLRKETLFMMLKCFPRLSTNTTNNVPKMDMVGL